MESNRLKKENHLLNRCRKKHLTKSNTHSWLKILRKVGIKGNLLKLIKNIHKNPTANVTTQWWETRSFLTKIRNKARISPSSPTSAPQQLNVAGEKKNHTECLTLNLISLQIFKISLFLSTAHVWNALPAIRQAPSSQTQSQHSNCACNTAVQPEPSAL